MRYTLKSHAMKIPTGGYIFRNVFCPGTFLLVAFLILSGCHSSSNEKQVMDNKQIIQKAFENWAGGEGSFFDLLAENAVWTITGSSPVSRTYHGRKQFIDEVINPLNERLSTKIIPSLRGVYADGDMVIALWDGKATAKDGEPYNNAYSWYMKMKDGKIVEVIAFFDTIDFTSLWKRITPAATN